MRLRWALMAWSVFAPCGTSPVPTTSGQDSLPSVVPAYDATRAQRLFGDLMSPFCPGLTLATCPSPGADSLRRDIRARLFRGESPGAIRATYAATWGEEILGAPRWRGWGIVLWLMPGVMLAVGAAVVVVCLLRVQRRGRAGAGIDEGAGAPTLPIDEGLKRRLERELAAFDDR